MPVIWFEDVDLFLSAELFGGFFKEVDFGPLGLVVEALAFAVAHLESACGADGYVCRVHMARSGIDSLDYVVDILKPSDASVHKPEDCPLARRQMAEHFGVLWLT